ncbi:ets DNA-binding protein pokkuri [Ischnura elegans]|uniref:ets DNA-binding protein pokkuri n=1 Tax=Ischnura elegans TaxID=197161 RepID=UPI001ED8B270|nr:ets DNA-binding protein pokkuri [Ischnura elegans]
MKLLPLQLPPGAGADRFTMPMGTFSAAADILWRYHAAATGIPAFPGTPPHTRLQAPPHPGAGAQQQQQQPPPGSGQPPPSPTQQLSPVDFKAHLPVGIESDPRAWTREDVGTFLRWCEKEFDLPRFDMDMFQMNGKAMCLLTKGDLSERAPGAGDVIHNALRLLLSRNQPSTPTALNLPSPGVPAPPHPGAVPQQQHPPTTPTSLHHPLMHPYHHLPSSPVTPTSTSYLPPTSSTPTSAPSAAAAAAGWSLLAAAAASTGASPSAAAAAAAAAAAGSAATSRIVDDFHTYGHHFMHQGNSVTLSPAPSIDSQSGSSPTQTESYSSNQQHGYGIPATTAARGSAGTGSGPSDSEEGDDDAFPGSAAERACSPEGSHQRVAPIQPPTSHVPSSPSTKTPPARLREIVQNSSETPEPNTNGRLLWDFLQQLLNDPPQRYGHFITWKNRETGVFKIVDPPGLAKLWGIQKNHLSMNYDKMSRALRYYYRVNILRKVQGERHCYQFLRNPSELKNIKNISLLRQQVVNGNSNNTMNDNSACHIGGVTITMKQEAPESPEHHNSHAAEDDEEEMATDLSLGGVDPLLPTDLSVGMASSRSSPSSGVLSSDDGDDSGVNGHADGSSRGRKRSEPYLRNHSEMKSSKSISLRRQQVNSGAINDGPACHIGGVTITVKQEVPDSPEHHNSEENDEVMATDLSISGADTDSNGVRGSLRSPLSSGGHSLYNSEADMSSASRSIKRSDSDVE